MDAVSEAVHAEADGPGKLQEYGALNTKKKIDEAWKRLEKGAIDGKNLMKNQPFVSDGPL